MIPNNLAAVNFKTTKQKVIHTGQMEHQNLITQTVKQCFTDDFW